MFKGDNVSISYVYCDYKDRAKQTATNLVASLAKQLTVQCNKMPQEVTDLYNGHVNVASLPSKAELSVLLRSLLSGFRRSFILVDALDEHFTNANEGSALETTLLDGLLDLQRHWPDFNLFFTSRDNAVIQERLVGSDSTAAACIEIFAADSDIGLYLRSRIHDHSKFRFANKMRDDHELAELVVRSLLQKAQGM